MLRHQFHRLTMLTLLASFTLSVAACGSEDNNGSNNTSGMNNTSGTNNTSGDDMLNGATVTMSIELADESAPQQLDKSFTATRAQGAYKLSPESDGHYVAGFGFSNEGEKPQVSVNVSLFDKNGAIEAGTYTVFKERGSEQRGALGGVTINEAVEGAQYVFAAAPSGGTVELTKLADGRMSGTFTIEGTATVITNGTPSSDIPFKLTGGSFTDIKYTTAP